MKEAQRILYGQKPNARCQNKEQDADIVRMMFIGRNALKQALKNTPEQRQMGPKNKDQQETPKFDADQWMRQNNRELSSSAS